MHWCANTLDAYSKELRMIANKFFTLVAKTLGIKPDEIRNLTEEGWQAMRMNYYPPCPEPDLVIGLKPHCDCPTPNAFIINIGDMLEVHIILLEFEFIRIWKLFIDCLVLQIVTNGIYRSVEPRATISSTKERPSIATVPNREFDGELCAASSLVTPEI